MKRGQFRLSARIGLEVARETVGRSLLEEAFGRDIFLSEYEATSIIFCNERILICSVNGKKLVPEFAYGSIQEMREEMLTRIDLRLLSERHHQPALGCHVPDPTAHARHAALADMPLLLVEALRRLTFSVAVSAGSVGEGWSGKNPFTRPYVLRTFEEDAAKLPYFYARLYNAVSAVRPSLVVR